MKLYAYRREKGQDQITDVWEAVRDRAQRPQAVKSVHYFSTQQDGEKRREVVLVRTHHRTFFRYKQAPTGVWGSEQSLTHLMAKEILSQMKEVRAVLPQGEITFFVDRWEKEKAILLPDGRRVIADLVAYFHASLPPKIHDDWQGRVIFEITVTHENTLEKIESLRQYGWPLLEVRVSPHLKIPEGPYATEEKVRDATEKMRRCYEQGVASTLIVDPSEKFRPVKRAWQRIYRFIDDIITN